MAVEDVSDNPFAPGSGTPPLHIAGRARELGFIDEALLRIRPGKVEGGRVRAVDPAIVLAGPRGVGKTLLLGLAKGRAGGLGIRTVDLSREKFESPGGVGEHLLPPGGIGQRLKSVPVEFRAGLGEYASAEYDPSAGGVRHDLGRSLDAALDEGPLLVMIDEAHTIAPGDLGAFCVAAQERLRDKRPLALVLAGTPGLFGLLMDMAATFMERSTRLEFNLLGPGEAKEALEQGFQKSGRSVTPGVVRSLVEWSDCYPYFVQLAGSATWRAAFGRGVAKVAKADARAGLAVADDFRRLFHRERYEELRKFDLLEEAALATGIGGAANGGIKEPELLEGLASAGGGVGVEQARQVRDSLLRLGFFFKDGLLLRPGIPSLFEYVRRGHAQGL